MKNILLTLSLIIILLLTLAVLLFKFQSQDTEHVPTAEQDEIPLYWLDEENLLYKDAHHFYLYSTNDKRSKLASIVKQPGVSYLGKTEGTEKIDAVCYSDGRLAFNTGIGFYGAGSSKFTAIKKPTIYTGKVVKSSSDSYEIQNFEALPLSDIMIQKMMIDADCQVVMDQPEDNPRRRDGVKFNFPLWSYSETSSAPAGAPSWGNIYKSGLSCGYQDCRSTNYSHIDYKTTNSRNYAQISGRGIKDRYHGIYVLTAENGSSPKWDKIISDSERGMVVSPDGCKVAYASANAELQQRIVHLKNTCES